MIRLPVSRVAPVLAAVAATFPLAARADDEVPPPTDLADAIEVVARSDAPAWTATPTVRVLGSDDIARRQAATVAEMLSEVPGAYALPDGPRGQFGRVSLRGAGTNQTLVVIDGVPQNDATAGGLFDFGDLSTAAADRIEVLNGSYAVLYGSEAIGGVVNVATRRGRGPWRGFAEFEGGSFGSHREVVGAGGGDDAFDLWVTGANEGARGDRRNEGFDANEVATRAGFRIAPGLRADLSLRALESRVESPYDFPGFGATTLPEDGNIERRRDTLSSGLTLTHEACGWLTTRLSASFLRVDGKFTNGPDGVERLDPDGTPGTGDELRLVRDELVSDTEARDVRLRLASTLAVGRIVGWKPRAEGGVELDVTGGAEHLDEDSRSVSVSPNFGAPGTSATTVDRNLDTMSLFALAEARFPDVGVVRRGVLSAGVRHDDHDAFGGETSPHVGLRFDVAPTRTTFRASWGEGFRAPKPSELDDAFVGNAALGPETSRSLDAGVTQSLLGDRLEVGATVFRLDTEGLIAYDAGATSPSRPFGQLVNFADTRTTGVEWEAKAELGGGFYLRAAYTRQNPRDRETGDPLANRSREFAGGGVTWERGAWLVSLDGLWSTCHPDSGGEYSDPDGDARRAPGRRGLVNLTARWRAAEGVTVFARVENLLDDEWVATPTSPAGNPVGFFAGVRFDF